MILLALLMIVFLFVLDYMRSCSFSLKNHKETYDTPGNSLCTLQPQAELHTLHSIRKTFRDDGDQ